MRVADATSQDGRGGAGREGRRAAGAGRPALHAARRCERAGAGAGRGRPGQRTAAGAAVRQRWRRPGSGAVEREEERKEGRVHT